MEELQRRLHEEWAEWQNSHPEGFIATPKEPSENGRIYWECRIPGPPNTSWVTRLFLVHLTFPRDYPTSPPQCE
ncbi:uncharacterized protein TRUGW13939_08813 [Talaromyces rugulosus]|uniref:UBC core domain-containing protein n=1 Tax=Talaromyces rugulosus TaxID=121627 RepID=A0A7H8R7D6_TALRU|nr:uncharacterized protein TRUGW13939_08813 [Talaromyces rugulosus]QKX61661.1 hypothetical protein TRUGW13939_08813 [Talaromyces rugulosus]